MNRFALVAVILLILGSLVFAGGQDELKVQSVTISVSHWIIGGDVMTTWFQWFFKDFETKNPNINFDINEIPDDIHRQKINTDFTAGVATDLILWYGGAESEVYAKAGRIADLTEFIKPRMDRFFPDLVNDMTFDGRIYGVPTDRNFFAFYLNTDIYDDYGFDFPKKFDDFESQITKFREKGLIPIILPGKNHPVIQHFFSYVANQTTSKTDFYNASYGIKGHNYREKGFVKAGEVVAELQSIGAFDPNVDGIPMTTAELMFNEGKGAMYFAGIWRVGAIEKDLRNKMHPIFFPEVPGFTENPNIATSQISMTWTVNNALDKNGPKWDAALAFLDYFASLEIQRKGVEMSDSMLCSIKGVDYDVSSYAVKESAKLIDIAETRPFLRFYQTPAQGNATKEMAWNIINGRGTVKENIEILASVAPNVK